MNKNLTDTNIEIRIAESKEDNPLLLDATNCLITFSDIENLPGLFSHEGDSTDIQCMNMDEGHDAYNPSPVIRARVHANDMGLTDIIALRTEARHGAYSALTRFYTFDPSGRCQEIEGISRMPWEDPHMVVLPDGRITACGVHVEWDADDPTKLLGFKTEYYIGESLDSMSYLGVSPYGHKDSRLVVRDDSSLGLYIRPQQRSGEGKIAYTPLADIEELAGDATAIYERAQLVGQGIFGENTWGGPNHAVDIGGGWDMVKCHIAAVLPGEYGDEEPHMIYSGFFMFHHPASGRVRVARPHASAYEFPHSDEYKWARVQDVVFPGGIIDIQVGKEGTLAAKGVYGLRDTRAVVRGLRSIVPVPQLLNAQI